MRGIGHISTLAEIAEPDIGVVVNVGSAHIELLGSIENIAEAKSELVRALPATGTAILNKDDPLVAKMGDSLNCEIRTFGEGQGSDFRASDVDIEPDGTTRFVITHGGQLAPGTCAIGWPALREQRVGRRERLCLRRCSF